MFVFNSGMGGYKCEKCDILIVKNLIIRKSKKGKELHYCSKECCSLHYNKKKI